MVAYFIEISKSLANFTNFFRGTYGSPRVAASASLPILMFRQLISAVNSAKNIKNCASRHKSMKLCMESVDGIRSQKPLRHTCWSLFLGSLQTGMGLQRKIIFFLQKY